MNSLMTSWRTNSPREGFTIVELLIVVVVIAILAAITIVAYNGITREAIVSSVKSDLHNGATQLNASKVIAGSFPSSGADIKKSDGVDIEYTGGGENFCLTAASGRFSDIVFHITQGGVIADGACPGHTLGGDPPVNSGEVQTIAGGTMGFTDGLGAVAQFRTLHSVAMGLSGDIYVTDAGNNSIRRITPAGQVTTVAGDGVAGYVDGTGAGARFRTPTGIAVGSTGDLYVADSGNHRIRKVSPGGEVTTLAGTGVAGFANGAGVSAQFDSPAGMAIDSADSLYVADRLNNRIRKILPSGEVSTVAGSGTLGFLNHTNSMSAQFRNPEGVALDSSGTIYVADSGNNRIRKVTSSGVTTLAGTGTAGFADGAAADAQLRGPRGMAVSPSGVVYIADVLNNRIRMISTEGVVSTLAGTGAAGRVDGAGDIARFYYPAGVALDSSGTLFAVSMYEYAVRRIQ